MRDGGIIRLTPLARWELCESLPTVAHVLQPTRGVGPVEVVAHRLGVLQVLSVKLVCVAPVHRVLGVA